MNLRPTFGIAGIFAGVVALLAAIPCATARPNLAKLSQKGAEAQVRGLLEPILEKYCREQCKLLGVNVAMVASAREDFAPGFEDRPTRSDDSLSPTSAHVKLMIDDRVDPGARGQLLDLIQQFLDNFEFPVKVETQIARFPAPIGTAERAVAFRERIVHRFRQAIDSLIQQYCPNRCLMAGINMDTDVVSAENAQFGNPEVYDQDGSVAIHLRDLSATLMIDEAIDPVNRAKILEAARLRTSDLPGVTLVAKVLRFPRPSVAMAEDSVHGELLAPERAPERTSERAPEGSEGIQSDLKSLKIYALVFGFSLLALIAFLIYALLGRRPSGEPHRPRGSRLPTWAGMQRVMENLRNSRPRPVNGSQNGSTRSQERAARRAAEHDRLRERPREREHHHEPAPTDPTATYRGEQLARRYEAERLIEDLTAIFAQHPKVTKYVFSRILTEEGVETSSKYIQLFGECVVIDMLRDPGLQSDISELMEYYARNVITISDEEKITLLRKLHNRTISGKLLVLGNRSSSQFDFLVAMDALQILGLIKNEALPIQAIVLTQCDPQKRLAIYSHLDDETRANLLSELSRIDYLPRDYIANVAAALRRKAKESPRLNTEPLPGTEVLISLLERTGPEMQERVIREVEASNPESARIIKNKLISINTLRYLRDNQLLEVVMHLKHDELLQFLKGAPSIIRKTIYSKSPKDLIAELEDEMSQVSALDREAYAAAERKVLNRIRVMANEGLISLLETNERMFSAAARGIDTNVGETTNSGLTGSIKKVAGW